jgi:hypothetical protein
VRIMSLNKWVEGKIREVLGQYCEINTEEMKIGLWKGDLVLQHVKLLPGPIVGTELCVVGGTIRRLELRVPWMQLNSKPVIVPASSWIFTVKYRDRDSDRNTLVALSVGLGHGGGGRQSGAIDLQI